MTRKIFNPAALAAIMALAACTNDEMQPSVNDSLTLGNAKNTVRISLSDAMGTRAARPIYSSEATNNINRIAFRLINSSKQEVNVLLNGVTDGDGSEILGASTTGNIVSLPNTYTGDIKVEFQDLPEESEDSYKIIAYGYNYDEDSGDTKDEFPYDIALSEHDGDLSFKCTGVETVQEIFAGANEGETDYIAVNKYGKFETPVSITLRRQVAGLLAYFVDAPAYVANQKVTKITVSSKAKAQGFYLPAILHTDDGYNGIDENYLFSDWQNYLTFDMSSATNYDNARNGEFYKFNGFVLAKESENIINKENLVCEESSLFGSCFMVPLPKYCDLSVEAYKCATLNICYWNGETLIKSIPLRSGGNEGDELRADSYQYGIKCNNFYSIGIKTDAENEDGNDNPLPIDDPTGYNDLTVTIDSQWIINNDFYK